MENYNDWFEQEFGMRGTTANEREMAALYDIDPLIITPAPSAPTAPSGFAAGTPTQVPSASTEGTPATPSAPSSSPAGTTPAGGMDTFRAAKCCTYREYCALVNRLKALDFAYYQQASPIVSDQEYEVLKLQCAMVEELNPDWLLPDSPTQIIGSDCINGLPRVNHRTPMLSLQKVAGTTDSARHASLLRWYNRTAQCKALSIEYKYDGNSVSLVYQDGQLIEASTRGQDGISGSLITAQVIGLPSIPKTITANGRIEVRGELLIPDANYADLWSYEKAKTQQAQVRKVLEQPTRPELAAQQGFLFVPFDVLGINTPSHTARLQWAVEQGFQAPSPVRRGTASASTEGTPASPEPRTYTFDELTAVIAHLENQRTTLGLPTDGIVIKLDHDDDRENFGETNHHPKWAIAWKYAAMRLSVTITRVGTTRTGKPCLYFDELTVNGARYDHVDVKAAAYQHHPFAPGQHIVVSLKPGSNSIQFEAPAAAPTPVRRGTASAITTTAPSPVRRGTASAPSAVMIQQPSLTTEPAATDAAATEPANDAAAYQSWLEAHAPEAPSGFAAGNPTEPTDEPTHIIIVEQPAQSPSASTEPTQVRRGTASATPTEQTPTAPVTRRALGYTLQVLGYTAAAVAALVIVWNTGLLIPLGLIGLGLASIE